MSGASVSSCLDFSFSRLRARPSSPAVSTQPASSKALEENKCPDRSMKVFNLSPFMEIMKDRPNNRPSNRRDGQTGS